MSYKFIFLARGNIDTTSRHLGAYEKTQKFEEKFVEPKYDIEEISKSKPIFTQSLNDVPPIQEGKNIHLECRLEPMGDPTMRVDWFHNGKPITVGKKNFHYLNSLSSFEIVIKNQSLILFTFYRISI